MKKNNKKHFRTYIRKFTAGLLAAGMIFSASGCGVVIEQAEKKSSANHAL